MINFVKS